MNFESAFEWGSEGREFKSHRPDQCLQGFCEFSKFWKNRLIPEMIPFGFHASIFPLSSTKAARGIGTLQSALTHASPSGVVL